MSLPSCISISEKTASELVFRIHPEAGVYRGLALHFRLTIKPSSYPFDPPRILSLDRLFHPNVCADTGAVCLSVLRLEWVPIMSVEAAVVSLLCLLLEEDSIDLDDCLNRGAADLYRSSYDQFVSKTRQFVNK